MRWLVRLPVVLVVFLVANVAWAESHLVLEPIKGDKKNALLTQIQGALCTTLNCISSDGLLKKGKPDWPTAQANSVVGFLSGTVKGKKLQLMLQTGPRDDPKKWTFTLLKGKITAGSLQKLTDETTQRVGAGDTSMPPSNPPSNSLTSNPPPSNPPPSNPPPSNPPPSNPPPSNPPPSNPPPSNPPPNNPPPTKQEVKPEAKAPTKPTAADENLAPLVHAEAGAVFSTRSQSYSDLTTNNLRSYSAPLEISPRLELEVYPLARFLDGILAGIGFDFSYQFAIGLQSAVTGGQTHSTSDSLLAADLRLRLVPLDSALLVLAPYVGFRQSTFSVAAAKDGSVLDGLPKISISALRLGIDTEIVPSSAFRIIVKADFFDTLSAPDLISADYFKKGSGFGIEATAGVAVGLVAGLDVRVLGVFQDAIFSFSSTPADTYQAKGASELHIGGQVLLGYTY